MKHVMATVPENQSVLCYKHPEHTLDSCTHCPMERGRGNVSSTGAGKGGRF